MSSPRGAQPGRNTDHNINPAAVPGGSPRGRPPKVGRQSRISPPDIISAAAAAFYAGGYTETTLAHVAQRLGVTDKALYHYFDNKDALYLETVKTCLEWVTTVIESIGREGGDGLTKIKTFAGVIIRGSGKRRPFLKCVPDHLVDTELGRQISETNRLHEERLIGWVEEGIGDGSIHPGNPHLLWKWNQGALIWLDTWARDGTCYSCEALEKGAMEMLDRSLAGRRDH